MKKTYNLGGQEVDAEKFKEYVKKYNHSDKGKATRHVWIEKNKTKIIEYRKKYAQQRKNKLKENGLCIYCGKNKPDAEYSTCRTCLDTKYSKLKKEPVQEKKVVE